MKKNIENFVDSYRASCISGKGAILFAVCRGKLSEGFDFPNEDAICACFFPYICFLKSRNEAFENISEKRNFLPDSAPKLKMVKSLG